MQKYTFVFCSRLGLFWKNTEEWKMSSGLLQKDWLTSVPWLFFPCGEVLFWNVAYATTRDMAYILSVPCHTTKSTYTERHNTWVILMHYCAKIPLHVVIFFMIYLFYITLGLVKSASRANKAPLKGMILIHSRAFELLLLSYAAHD